MTINELHQHFLNSRGITTDSREPLSGKLFFALKGENFDGNQYAQKAVDQGAVLAVVDHRNLPQHNQYVQVNDVLTTLQKLAHFHRKYLEVPILALSGSNGKTTTKELIAAVLKQKYKVTYTQGNLNNHIGVPLTLLTMDDNTEFGVVEMGANHQKEIESLCQIAQPDYGYITNFGKAHLEGFGGVEGVIKGKSELYDFLRNNEKYIFVNADDEVAMKQSLGGNRISFAEDQPADYNIRLKKADPMVKMVFGKTQVNAHLIGRYNATNIAAAICVGRYFGISPKTIKEAVEHYRPDNNRSQIIEKGSNKIILDAYNANPTSMKLAIQSFEAFPGNSKVAILGDMLELGEMASDEHQQIVDLLENSSIDQAFVCGQLFGATRVEKVSKFKTFEELQTKLCNQPFKNRIFLVKGSRGMAMERCLEFL